MPKHTDESDARAAAERIVADMIDAAGDIGDIDLPRRLRTHFPSAEFERSTSRVKGEGVTLRRLHLIGEWEVDTTPDPTPTTTRTTT